jgi:cell division protein FtsA
MQDLAEQVFDLPVRIGYPEGVGGLYDMVNNPKYATAVGLLLYGAEKRVPTGEKEFRIREDNVFNRILGKMKKWFVDIA